MPVVFSPGEPETRPLDPDAIVYTTAQKVADLLGVGRGEAVLMSSNAEANGIFVTGGDHRNHGFAIGDTILIYSDADPLGLERDITAITSTTSGVKLAFSSAINPGLYETADNGYVQNTAAFTNGKTRGVTKAIVETRIKETQDRIDNVTHNAWRPYLVSAEYLNFDTYKPYRRRYYTDYVGTTPLLFRNVQQILRLEVWQGENYREIGCAEVRVELKDTLTTDEIITIGLEGGFKADMGAVLDNTTATFDIRFDKVNAAQSLADLVNKEDRVGKAAINFAKADGTPFTMAGSTSNVALNNEILATANADYGNGKVKLTSMRQTKGGESVSIASTNLDDITFSQMTSVSTTSTSVSSTTVNVASTTGFADGGVLMVGDGTGTNVETLVYQSKTATTFVGCANLNGTPLSTLNTGGTTVFQYLFQSDIGQYSDAGGDQARLKDWWLDHEMGIIYFNNSYPFFEWNAVKVSYIYGERYVEKAIEEAATKLVASELLMADDRSVLIPEGTQNVDLGSKIQLWRKEAMEILNRYKEIVVFS